eukprot:7375341-Lingulodinium_polyedra.AAC.1
MHDQAEAGPPAPSGCTQRFCAKMLVVAPLELLAEAGDAAVAVGVAALAACQELGGALHHP